MSAGLVDSFCLSMAWTVVVLEVTRQHGLLAAGACSTAMLLGVALSAPIATWMAHRLDGRRLLRVAGLTEAALRISLFVLLVSGSSVWLIAGCVAAMNVVAWTGYAGMRAEVAAVTEGAGGITWYGTIVAAVEAMGVAAGAFVPTNASGRPSDTVFGVVALLYVAALVPTLVVAGGSRVPRAVRTAQRAGSVVRPSAVTVQGAVLMMVASGPTLLAVALAAELHGRTAVGLAAVAFTLGSLLAPAVANSLERRGLNEPSWWVLLALGMVSGWVLAPVSIAWLCVAQVLSGLCMTALEGLLDTAATQRRPDAVTAALARSTAARALGSSGGTAILPLAIAAGGLSLSSAVVVGGLTMVVVAIRVSRRGPAAGTSVGDRLPDDVSEWAQRVVVTSSGRP